LFRLASSLSINARIDKNVGLALYRADPIPTLLQVFRISADPQVEVGGPRAWRRPAGV
jgi:hypothetical protein